jgi:hypothetical protein
MSAPWFLTHRDVRDRFGWTLEQFRPARLPVSRRAGVERARSGRAWAAQVRALPLELRNERESQKARAPERRIRRPTRAVALPALQDSSEA